MADHTSPEPESLSFAPMFRPQAEGQRSSHELYQQSSMSGLGSFEVPCEGTDSTGSALNGIDQSASAAYWANTSPVSSMGMNRIKAQVGVYEPDWISHCHQQEAEDCYGASGREQQKLDSFSEAFCSRSSSRMLDGGEQSGFNSTHPSSNSLSFPLVLSPPPTPLPPASFSPPKRPQHFLPGQILSQSQMQTQTDGSLQFFPSLPSPSTSRPNHPIWLQLQADGNDILDLTQHFQQESNSSLLYSEHGGPHLKQINSLQKDCSMQMSLNPALAQNHHPQSCVQQQLGHESGTSEDHMTWPQMGQSSHSYGPSGHQSSLHVQGSGPGEGSRFSFGVNFSPGSSDKPHGSFSTQNVPSSVYTGVPFNSVIQQSKEFVESWEGTVPHYTPPPMLNPTRSGTGLFCNLLSSLAVENRALWTDERKDDDSQRCINIGPEFQAELPDLMMGREHGESPEEVVREELLWKPWAELEENDTLLQHVENLLDLSASSVLPGGGANLELALHSLSCCKGNILAALEMLLFKDSPPSENYHYSGMDIWTSSEQRLFHEAFTIYGKDFSFVHKMVKTKQVSQCIEYYYNSKRLSEKQRKQMEREKESLEEERLAAVINQVLPAPKMLVNQASIERLIHTPPLPTSFPCKQCGKMFYKIKSRNAHMKIHRQQQEDWREKLQIHPNQHHLNRTLAQPNQQILNQAHHQNHILTQTLIQNLVQSQNQLAFLQSSRTQSTCPTSSTSCITPTQSPQIVAKAPPLPLHTGHQQTWSSLHNVETGGLFYNRRSMVNGLHLSIQDSLSKPWTDTQ
ncbi:suppressor of activated egl-4 protein 1 [Pseudorasbora parva]|uniref:suppressor of activated egl-4 protein 1 n=1 Tax=Pseudorasbora parva TaxID=51549 RepID=UPI00351E9B1B